MKATEQIELRKISGRGALTDSINFYENQATTHFGPELRFGPVKKLVSMATTDAPHRNIQEFNSVHGEHRLELEVVVDEIMDYGNIVAKVHRGISTFGSGHPKITAEMLDDLEALMLQLPQVDVPINHSFPDGLYVRDGTMPRTALILGHAHRHEHYCVVLTGRMTLLNADKTTTEIVAPCAFVGKPGRKLLFIQEDVRMQNIHPTAGWPAELFTDVDKMEDFIYAKGYGRKAYELNGKRPLRPLEIA